MLDTAVGIDYGTSNTVAVLRHADGKVRPLLFDSSPLLPSAAFAKDTGRIVVGQDAERSARLDPARFEPHPKRRIDDLDVLLGERAYPVTDLVAAALTRVRAEAVRALGGAVRAVTMTFPATWGTARRQVLLDAAAGAGLPLPTLVPEPVAAATYFVSVLGHRIRPGQCVVVYDLGAGTFDVSVVQRTDDGFRDLSCRGLDDVGGVDLDALVVAHARSVIEPSAPDVWKRLSAPQSAADLRHVTMLWTDARHLREALSREASASMFVPVADQEVLMTRQQFEAAAQPVLQRTVELALSTLKQARVRAEDVVGWFLVGGGTRTPLVATLLHRASGVAPTVLEEPQFVVAEGALHSPSEVAIGTAPVPRPAAPPSQPAPPSTPAAPPSTPATPLMESTPPVVGSATPVMGSAAPVSQSWPTATPIVAPPPLAQPAPPSTPAAPPSRPAAPAAQPELPVTEPAAPTTEPAASVSQSWPTAAPIVAAPATPASPPPSVGRPRIGQGELFALVAAVFAAVLVVTRSRWRPAELVSTVLLAIGIVWRTQRIGAGIGRRADWAGIGIAGLGAAGLAFAAAMDIAGAL